MKKRGWILFVSIGLLHLSSCDNADSSCLDPKLCPEKTKAKKTRLEKAEKQQRRW